MEQLNKIADSVYKATVSGNLKWGLSNSIFNSDTVHKYSSTSTDGKTKFNCRITLSKDLKCIDPSYCSLDVNNDDIVDGTVSIRGKVVVDIHTWIYDNHIKKGLMSKNQNIVYEDILKSIDISEYREEKINKVLDCEEKKDDEKKGLFNRLFK